LTTVAQFPRIQILQRCDPILININWCCFLLDLVNILLLVAKTGSLNKLSVHYNPCATLQQIPLIVVIFLYLSEMFKKVLVNLLFLANFMKIKDVNTKFRNIIGYLPWLHRNDLEFHTVYFFALRGDNHVLIWAINRNLIGCWVRWQEGIIVIILVVIFVSFFITIIFLATFI